MINSSVADFERGLPPVPRISEHDVRPEVVGSPAENFREAEEVLGMIREAPGDDTVGQRVAEIADAASMFARNEGAGSPEATDEALVLGDAEALVILGNEDPTGDATRSLGQLPELPEVMDDLASVDASLAASTTVAEKIKEVTKIVVSEGMIDNLTPGMRELAEIYGNSGHLEVIPIPGVFGELEKSLRKDGYPFKIDIIDPLRQEAKNKLLETVAANPRGIDRMISVLLDSYVTQEKAALIATQQYVKLYGNIEPLSNAEIDIQARENALRGDYLDGLLLRLSSEDLRSIRELPPSQRKGFDKLCEEYLNRELPIYSNGDKVGDKVASNELFRARLEGFTSLMEKVRAIENGAIPEPENGHPTRLDTLSDFFDCDMPNEAYRGWLDKFLRGRLKLHPTVSADILVATMERSRSGRNTPAINGRTLFREMEQIQKSVESIGIDNLERLRNKCGIVNIHQLSEEQVSRMLQFANADPELAKTLHDKEVCVILRDATADWNGAFSHLNSEYETVDGATLVFEISDLGNPNQLKSFANNLRAQGVHAAALVIAGHGMPGDIQMGETSLSFRDRRGKGEYSPVEAGLGIILEDMEPDRDGNCSVIFNSCSQAASIGPDFDSSLTRIADLAHASKPEATFHAYGIEKPGSMRPEKSAGGRLKDGFGQPIEHVIIASSGNKYQFGQYKEKTLPMFLRNNGKEEKAA